MKWLVLLILLIAAVACNESSPDAERAQLPSPVPTATVTALPTETPIPPLNLSDTVTFTHTNRLFAINHPNDWQIVEQDNGVVVLSPANRMGLTVVFTNAGESYSSAELEQYLLGFIAQNFDQAGADFEALGLEQRADGSIVADFSAQDPEFERMVNQVKVIQQDGVIFLVYASAPETVWQAYSESLQALVNSLAPLETTGLQERTPEPPVWTLIGPDNREFGFLVSDDWQIINRDQSQVSVQAPTGNMGFTASNFTWPDATADPRAAAEDAVLAHLAELTRIYTDVQHLPPTEFPLDTTTGATIDFVYLDENGETIAGSVITGVGNGKMHKIEFTAPTDFYDTALEWFNPMYRSFKFLSPGEGLDD
jgi:hypothetical protein